MAQMSRKLQSRRPILNQQSIRYLYSNKKSNMIRDCHARANRLGSSSGRSKNAGPNTLHNRDGKPDSRLCSVRESSSWIIKRDRALVSITNNAIIVDSGASGHVIGYPTLLTEVEKVPNIQVEFPNGLRVASKQRGRLILMIGSERLTSCSAERYILLYPCILKIKLNIPLCCRLDKKGITTSIRNGFCSLTYRRGIVTLAKIARSSSDGLFVTNNFTLPEVECNKQRL